MPTSPTGINRKTSQAGFTLIEVLAVLAIIAFVGIGAVSVSAQVSTSARLREAAMQLMDDIALLRTEAALRNRPMSISITPQGHEYGLDLLGIQRALPLGMTVALAPEASRLARPDTPTVVFHPDGVTAPARFTLQAGSSSRTVDVTWPSGFTRLQP